jgi:hypothetical protein
MQWLIVVLQASVSMCLAMSYMYYNIIMGLISGCIVVLIRKVLGCFVLVC